MKIVQLFFKIKNLFFTTMSIRKKEGFLFLPLSGFLFFSALFGSHLTLASSTNFSHAPACKKLFSSQNHNSTTFPKKVLRLYNKIYAEQVSPYTLKSISSPKSWSLRSRLLKRIQKYLKVDQSSHTDPSNWLLLDHKGESQVFSLFFKTLKKERTVFSEHEFVLIALFLQRFFSDINTFYLYPQKEATKTDSSQDASFNSHDSKDTSFEEQIGFSNREFKISMAYEILKQTHHMVSPPKSKFLALIQQLSPMKNSSYEKKHPLSVAQFKYLRSIALSAILNAYLPEKTEMLPLPFEYGIHPLLKPLDDIKPSEDPLYVYELSQALDQILFPQLHQLSLNHLTNNNPLSEASQIWTEESQDALFDDESEPNTTTSSSPQKENPTEQEFSFQPQKVDSRFWNFIFVEELRMAFSQLYANATQPVSTYLQEALAPHSPADKSPSPNEKDDTFIQTPLEKYSESLLRLYEAIEWKQKNPTP